MLREKGIRQSTFSIVIFFFSHEQGREGKEIKEKGNYLWAFVATSLATV